MSWLTDWDEAARYPIRARAAIYVGFVGTGVLVELLAGYVHQGFARSIGVALVFAAILSLLVEPFVRRRLAGDDLPESSRLARQIGVATVFCLAIVVGAVAHSVLAAGLVSAAAVGALAIGNR